MQQEPNAAGSGNSPPGDFSLREVEEHFAELVAGIEDHAIFLLDPTGRIMSWNAGARRLKGYEPHEIIGQHFSRFYPQEAIDRDWPGEELRQAAEVGRFEDEGWRIRKDGSQFWANVVITALRSDDGDVRGFIKITRDLTERKQADEALRQSEERLRLMIENVKDYAIFMLDPDGRVATWNAGAERIKGYAAGEIIGQHFSKFYTPEDLASGKPARELQTAISVGRVEDEGWRVRKDHTLFWANVVITALFDKGELRGFAKVTRDMTERRQIEQLQVADKQKNVFLAMLAHELRNPLAPIRNGVELLKMSSRAEPELHETAEMMERQILHLVRLVDDLLDVSRIVTGKIHLEKKAIDVASFISRAAEEMQPDIDARGHELMLSLPARPLVVDGDVVRLSQVVSNLLSNAAKFTDEPSQIWLTVERVGDEAVIRVRDRGLGMTPDVLSQIFNLFAQGDNSTSRSRGGLGIGLTLVKRIVEMHGGIVTAHSAGLAQGTEFTIRLPVSEQSRAEATPGASWPRKAPKSTGRRILVVDDNVDAAMSVAALLKLWGHEVQTAFNGEAALEAALKFRPHIVLLDIAMPGMNGYEVARRLRADPQFEGLIITALTGYGQTDDRLRSRDAGFDHHLTKPPDPEVLAALLQSA